MYVCDWYYWVNYFQLKIEIWINLIHFHSRKCFWEFRLQNDDHLIQAQLCLFNIISCFSNILCAPVSGAGITKFTRCFMESMALFNYPDSKVHGANMELIWGRQDPGGPHVGPMNFAFWVHLIHKRPQTHYFSYCFYICRYWYTARTDIDRVWGDRVATEYNMVMWWGPGGYTYTLR